MAQKPNPNTLLEKKICDAIQKLIAQGETVTNEKVRDLIGGGSYRDISVSFFALRSPRRFW